MKYIYTDIYIYIYIYIIYLNICVYIKYIYSMMRKKTPYVQVKQENASKIKT